MLKDNLQSEWNIYGAGHTDDTAALVLLHVHVHGIGHTDIMTSMTLVSLHLHILKCALCISSGKSIYPAQGLYILKLCGAVEHEVHIKCVCNWHLSHSCVRS